MTCLVTAPQHVGFVGAEEPATAAVVNIFTGPVLSVTHVKKEVLQATKDKRRV